jgi:hypothetical protein
MEYFPQSESGAHVKTGRFGKTESESRRCTNAGGPLVTSGFVRFLSTGPSEIDELLLISSLLQTHNSVYLPGVSPGGDTPNHAGINIKLIEGKWNYCDSQTATGLNVLKFD